MKTYQAQYRNIIEDCLMDGHMAVNKRTGKGLLVMPHAVMITADLEQGVPIIDCRRTWPHTAMAELCWMLMGTEDAAWVNARCSLWKGFTHEGVVPNAYGHRMRHKFGRDQLNTALVNLMADHSDRRQYVSYWDPSLDGHNGQYNTPCPLGFTLSVSHANRLNMMVPVRSSDLILGLPTDMMTHAYLLGACAKELGLQAGVLSLALAHPHVYTDHADQALEMLQDRVELPRNTFMPSLKRLMDWPEDTVQLVKCHDAFHHPTVRRFDVAL